MHGTVVKVPLFCIQGQGSNPPPTPPGPIHSLHFPGNYTSQMLHSQQDITHLTDYNKGIWHVIITCMASFGWQIFKAFLHSFSKSICFRFIQHCLGLQITKEYLNATSMPYTQMWCPHATLKPCGTLDCKVLGVTIHVPWFEDQTNLATCCFLVSPHVKNSYNSSQRGDISTVFFLPIYLQLQQAASFAYGVQVTLLKLHGELLTSSSMCEHFQ